MAMLDNALDFQTSFQEINGTSDSTDTIDLESASTTIANLPVGQPVNVVTTVGETFNTLTSLTISLQGSTAAGGTYYTLASTQVLLAELVKGKQFVLTVGGLTGYRYLKMVYTVGGSNPSTGMLRSHINCFSSVAQDAQFPDARTF